MNALQGSLPGVRELWNDDNGHDVTMFEEKKEKVVGITAGFSS